MQPNVFKKKLSDFVERLYLKDLLYKPVRQLSLGERMRFEIVASFLYCPEIVFLDEPTIGLDIVAKSVIRDFLLEMSKNKNVTLLLTSHDTDDIEKICDRVIIIDKGQIIFDGDISNLKANYKQKIITIIGEENIRNGLTKNEKDNGLDVLEKSPYHIKLYADLSKTSIQEVTLKILQHYTVRDLTIENPSLETIIKTLYDNKNFSAKHS